MLFLLPLLCVGVVSSQPIMDCQGLFSIVVSRAQHLHLLAQKLLSDFVSVIRMLVVTLVPVCEVVLLLLQVEEQTEGQRQVNKIFPRDLDCRTDYIISPIDKHETQSSSVGGAVMSVLLRLSHSSSCPLLHLFHSSSCSFLCKFHFFLFTSPSVSLPRLSYSSISLIPPPPVSLLYHSHASSRC